MQSRAPKEQQDSDESPRQDLTRSTASESVFYERMVAAQGKCMTYLQGRQVVTPNAGTRSLLVTPTVNHLLAPKNSNLFTSGLEFVPTPDT